MCDYYLSQQVNQSSSVKVPVSLQFQLQANDNWTSKWSKIIAGSQAPGGGGYRSALLLLALPSQLVCLCLKLF